MIPLAEIEAARDRIAGAAVRTPLVRLPDTDIWLKLENLQPVSSFKIRGATNAIRAASSEELAGGVVTASAGNMAQGVAWAAREAGVPATIICPDGAPQTKLDRIESLGGRVIQVPWDEWWQTIVDSRFDGVHGLFVHPVQDERVMAGNGTIGLELVADLPDLETVLVPYGGGGLSVDTWAYGWTAGANAGVLFPVGPKVRLGGLANFYFRNPLKVCVTANGTDSCASSGVNPVKTIALSFAALL